jgi:hypothetical protein
MVPGGVASVDPGAVVLLAFKSSGIPSRRYSSVLEHMAEGRKSGRRHAGGLLAGALVVSKFARFKSDSNIVQRSNSWMGWPYPSGWRGISMDGRSRLSERQSAIDAVYVD